MQNHRGLTVRPFFLWVSNWIQRMHYVHTGIFDHTAEYVVGNEHEMIFQIVSAAKMSRGGNICIPNNNITFTHS